MNKTKTADPTPGEIHLSCLEIRRNWTDAELHRHSFSPRDGATGEWQPDATYLVPAGAPTLREE